MRVRRREHRDGDDCQTVSMQRIKSRDLFYGPSTWVFFAFFVASGRRRADDGGRHEADARERTLIETCATFFFFGDNYAVFSMIRISGI